jgi:ketosteroid isomerase-like protein
MVGAGDPQQAGCSVPVDLKERMAAFDRCVRDSDVSLAEDVLDEEYALVLVQPAPAAMPRARWLEVLPSYLVHDYEIEEQSVDVSGDLAVVLQRVRMSATVLGEDRSGVFVISDVWRKRDGRWHVWRRHSTPLAAGKLPGTEA